MADETKISTEMSSDNKKVDITHKRKRVKRIKIAIIITILFLFLLPTILCIILGIQLGKLQRQVDKLSSTYSINTEEKSRKNIGGKYAYASTDESVVEIIESIDKGQDDTSHVLTEHQDDIEDIDDDNTDSPGDSITEEDLDIQDETDTPKETDTPEETDAQGEADIQDGTDIQEGSGVDEAIDLVDDTESGISGSINKDSTYDSNEQTIDQDGIYHNKKVYLTFDDGPTKHTDEILDILADYDIKATFFVIGHNDEVSKERYKRIVNDGHVLGIHSYSHKYKDIYKSLENFDKDFTKLWNLLYDTTGYTPTLYRFPGGSLGFLNNDKMKDYVNFLNEKGMTYYDWNVVNGDAEGINYTEEQMIDNVLNGVARKKTSIVLMHDGDGKSKTVATLPDILDALISGGAEVLPMDDTTPLIQQIKASSLK